jgi:flagellar basal-body rod protein FlgF
MDNIGYISLSRLSMLKQRLNTIAQNLSNMNTTGFKQQMLVVNEYQNKTSFRGHVSQVQDFAMLRNLRQGELDRTDNQLDVALRGDGYLVVETLSGIRYTRGGPLAIDSQGRLSTSTGLPVLNTQDQPIVVPEEAGDLRITPDGAISYRADGDNDFQQIGQIQVVRFDLPHYMTMLGDGLYETDEDPQPDPDTAVIQFMREKSNVNPILEMTNMIEVSNQYKSTQNFMDKENERQMQMMRRLGRAQ